MHMHLVTRAQTNLEGIVTMKIKQQAAMAPLHAAALELPKASMNRRSLSTTLVSLFPDSLADSHQPQ